MEDEANSKRTFNVESWIVFGFGVLSLVFLFAIALFTKEHNPLLITTARITIAIACAGVAAIIPGFIHIDLSGGMAKVVRAGGAMAVFVLVYFFNPPGLISSTEETVPNPPSDYMPIVYDWLKIVDSGDYLTAYNNADPSTRENYSAELFESLFSGYLKPLGSLKSRNLLSANSLKLLPTGEKGNFRLVVFESNFEFGGAQIEQILVSANSGKWLVRNHTLTPKSLLQK